ncbi:type II toxin-antitoxin system RelE/ParE family toxin, partial [Mycobacterium tuberculosis]|nr:type II toxin-antitoxin system RelE/ParE family toxin [Mycobacterium tuberculosis]MBP0651697.1 type II toxin-antitoxin system RelE/ParE family toxin [Mycobacterium tuberculosis]
MTRRVWLSPQAAAWLKAEIAYLAERSPSAAAAVALRFRRVRQSLDDNPLLGQIGLIPGTRRLVVAPYVLT